MTKRSAFVAALLVRSQWKKLVAFGSFLLLTTSVAMGGSSARSASFAVTRLDRNSVASAPKASTSVTLVTKGPVRALAADGRRAALMISERGRWRIVVWEPAAHRVLPIHTESDADFGGSLALAGSRVAWNDWSGGLTIQTRISSATLARRRAVSLGSGDTTLDGGPGEEALAPNGDGKLLAFTTQERCDEFDEDDPCPPGRQTGDVVAATIWRVAPHGICPAGGGNDFRPPGHCARVAMATGKLTVLAVDAGRIAARSDGGVRLLTGGGHPLRDFPVKNVSTAALSGNRLALRVPGTFEIYDTGSGELVKSFPAQGNARLARLEDLEHGILVTAMGRTVTLRRLRDGRKATMRTHGIAHARLERAGLFVAGGHRVTFTPMHDLLRLLGARAPGS
jgi:hypothetical protein